MAFDQGTRNRLARFVGDARSLLSEEFSRQLQNEYGLDPENGTVTELEKLTSLDDRRRETARILRETMDYYLAGKKVDAKAQQDVLQRIVREQAFTVLNRLCALRMAESRGILLESIARGYQSKGFQLYARLAGTGLGETGDAYRSYLFSLFDEFAVDLAVLFDRFSPQGRLFPRQTALNSLLDLINDPEIEQLWAEDETIGWMYQYFNTKEERKAMRDASQAPRNSRELAVRNQFFTPRYVVEFLTDNTLGRIWYEMTQGETALKDSCRYLVRRPTEIFLKKGETAPAQNSADEELSQEELLKQPVYIPYRQLKDPRELKMLDPACGSMHFGLYAFDLFEQIYAEAWDLEETLGENALWRLADLDSLHQTYSDRESFLRDVPRLIIERNIHGVDIDPRAVQIAGLSLWLRAQKSWQAQGVKPQERSQIRRSNIVCAEPMPGDREMLEEFLGTLKEDRLEDLMRRALRVPAGQKVRATKAMADALGHLVRTVWQEMELAGEAGSLLKIEETLRGAIATAQKEAEEKSPLFRVLEFGLSETVGEQVVPVLAGEEQGFWHQAERLVLAALETYAESAANGGSFRRRLFAGDAVQGFAFIELCRKKYDAVVMNPPFGLPTKSLTHQIKTNYPDTYVDLYASFVSRGLGFTTNGFVGAITSRAFEMTKKLTRWRENQVVLTIELLIDLGLGVMDDAFVEAAAYTLRTVQNPNAILFVDRRFSIEKNRNITFSDSGESFLVKRTDIQSIPGQKLLYSLPPGYFSLLRSPSTFEPNIGTAREGLRTFDDFRFVRLRWEVVINQIGENKIWESYSKGGEYSQYYSDIHLLVKWNRSGNELAEVNRKVNGQVAQARQASDYYRKPGATYSKRSAKGFSARALPAGCIIGTKGPAVLSESSLQPNYLVGWLNSDLIINLVHIQANAFEFNTGIIKKLPWYSTANDAKLADISSKTILGIMAFKCLDETNSLFMKPVIKDSVTKIIDVLDLLRGQADQTQKMCREYWNASLKDAYSVSNIDQSISLVSEEDDTDDDEADVVEENDLRVYSVVSIVLYVIGCGLGRWDIRYPTGEKTAPELPDPFAPLPACPPGMLQNTHGLPAAPEDLPASYPLRISWGGILTDDEGHPEAIETRAREALHVIWGERAEALEVEACQILGVRSLREYFQKPGLFFAEHLKRYSKSRRQAPIYWPLSTSSGSYTLWLYYHRLSDQTLFTCVNDFVDPKLKQVSDDAKTLRQKKNRSSAEEKELERLTDFERELKDFRDELLRVAKFWNPNLNDGVQITAAPLWKLFQHRLWQKKLKETWEKLEAGEYDWAHLAYSIWPERVREKCKTDKSLAIAHDLEHLYVEPKTPLEKKAGRKKQSDNDMEAMFDDD